MLQKRRGDSRREGTVGHPFAAGNYTYAAWGGLSSAFVAKSLSPRTKRKKKTGCRNRHLRRTARTQERKKGFRKGGEEKRKEQIASNPGLRKREIKASNQMAISAPQPTNQTINGGSGHCLAFTRRGRCLENWLQNQGKERKGENWGIEVLLRILQGINGPANRRKVTRPERIVRKKPNRLRKSRGPSNKKAGGEATKKGVSEFHARPGGRGGIVTPELPRTPLTRGAAIRAGRTIGNQKRSPPQS